MSVKALLEEMLQLLREQVGHVVKGEHRELLDGAYRHEQLLSDLEAALAAGPPDISPEELRPLYEEIETEKAKLQSLLQAESARTDFMLRVLLGSRQPKADGYTDIRIKRRSR